MLRFSDLPAPELPNCPAQLDRFIARMRAVREGEERLATLLANEARLTMRDLGMFDPQAEPRMPTLLFVRAPRDLRS